MTTSTVAASVRPGLHSITQAFPRVGDLIEALGWGCLGGISTSRSEIVGLVALADPGEQLAHAGFV